MKVLKMTEGVMIIEKNGQPFALKKNCVVELTESRAKVLLEKYPRDLKCIDETPGKTEEELKKEEAEAKAKAEAEKAKAKNQNK